MVKHVRDKFYIAVAPRRGQNDIEEAAKGGINMLINNRPDGEADDQMSSAEIEAAAKAAGVEYVHIPIIPAKITDEQISEMVAALERAGDGYILATCRTGMRSMIMYSLAQAKIGKKYDDLLATAKMIGFDLMDHRDRMMRLQEAYTEAEKAKAKAEAEQAKANAGG